VCYERQEIHLHADTMPLKNKFGLRDPLHRSRAYLVINDLHVEAFVDRFAAHFTHLQVNDTFNEPVESDS